MARLSELVVTGLLVGSAVGVAVAAIHREFAKPQIAGMSPGVGPTFVASWEEIVPVGTWIGDSTAKVKIIEFADFECPFCRRFHERFLEAREKFGKNVALLFVQFPLPSHKFARPAALASECALAEGRFAEFHDALFEKQDSLGLRSWAEYAAAAGIRDTVRFNACVRTRTHSARLDSAVAMGAKYKLHGTPTVIINGWRMHIPPYDSLTNIVEAALKRAGT